MNGTRTGVDDPYAGLVIVSSQTLRGARRVIAQRLTESWASVVPVTLHRPLDISTIGGVAALSHVTDTLLCAIVQALQAHPALNAIFVDGTYRTFASVNLGIAVDTSRGLVVPVLHNLHGRSPSEIAARRRQATERVLAWQHNVDDLVGGTFTVSNLGTLGVEYFTPIINPPQVAILGVGHARSELITPPAADGDLRARWVLPVSLTFDHRIVDGADAARFLETVQDGLRSSKPDITDA